KGEILGVAGLVGSGRTELLETIYGTVARGGGKIKIHGKEVGNKHARESIKNGFALVTEERRATGIFGVLDINANATVANLKNYRKVFYLENKKMVQDSEWVVQSMRVKTPSLRTKIGTLSGGNQQKVILGRWLLTVPEVLLLDEPTRGIDVGAKYEIYQLMNNLASEQKAIIMVSSEMAELLGVCDRIMVMSGGRMAGIVDAKTTTQEEIMRLSAKYV
ncbi:MAG: ATP-binding cassette domain-containing protein, partial [Bacillota bacterium]|nr:ATP-binding cassette domain-containing protein [Bacillota bacterium]